MITSWLINNVEYNLVLVLLVLEPLVFINMSVNITV
jgi:hypothetical protein